MNFTNYLICLLITCLLQSLNYLAAATTALSWRDLNYETSSDFNSQASNWVLSTGGSAVTDISNACTSFPALVFSQSSGSLERTYELLQSHVSVFITVEITFIDDWNLNDQLSITVGTSSPLQFSFGGSTSGSFPDTECGTSTQPDLPSVTTEILSTNSDTNLTLQFSKTTSASTSQFAIRNLNIVLSNQSLSTVTSSSSDKMCFFTTNSALSSSACTCPLGQFESTTSPGTCVDCHYTCETCYADSRTSCLTCSSGLTLTGSSCSICDSSCETCFGTLSNQCSSCYSGYYLYSDSICRGYCAANYTRSSGGINYCDDPLTTVGTNSTNTTNSTETNSTNSTSEPTYLCNSLNTANYDEVSSGVLYYYTDLDICKTSCPQPYTATGQDQIRYCTLILSEEDQNLINSISSAATSASAVMTAGVFAMTAVKPSDPNGISVGTLSKLFEYTRYINVNRSAKLEAFYISKAPSPGTITIPIYLPDSFVELFTERALPSIFDQGFIYSSFLANFFPNLETLLIISAAVILLSSLQRTIMKKLNRFAELYKKVVLAGVAFLIMQFYNIYAEMLFMGTIEFMSFAGGNAWDWISFFLAIIFYSLAFFILGFHFRLIWKYQKVKSHSPIEDNKDNKALSVFVQKHEKAEALYKAFNDSTFTQQAYLFFLTLRSALTGIVMSAFYNYPGFQVAFQITMNIVMILHLLLKAPYKDLPTTYQQLAFEVDLFFTNMCLLFMVMLDATEAQSDDLRTQLGDAIIMAIFVSKFITLITIIPKVIEGIQIAVKMYKERKNGKSPSEAQTPNQSSSPVIEPRNSKSTLNIDEAQPIMHEAIAVEFNQKTNNEEMSKKDTLRKLFEKDEKTEREDDEIDNEGPNHIMQSTVRGTIMK